MNAMSERILRHLVARHLTDFLQDWYGRPANADSQPTEHDFAAWLTGHAGKSPARTPA
jgi:hypothetical protein